MRYQHCAQEATPAFLHALHHARSCWEEAQRETTKLEQDLDHMRGRVTELENIMHALESWPGTAAFQAPRPAAAPPQQAPAPPVSADTAAPAKKGRPMSPRMNKVLDLLKQDPARWWKNRQIADAIGEDPRLLRMSLSYMVDSGRIVKNADARYRYSGENSENQAVLSMVAAV